MAGLKQKTLSEENLTALLALIGEVQASPTANTALARLKDLLTGIVLAAGTNTFGKLASNSGVDIGDVDVPNIDIAISALRDALLGKAATFVPSGPTIGNSSTTALAANANRKTATFVNDSDETIYLARGATAVINQGIRLNAFGGSFEINSGNLYVGVVTAICASGGKVLCVEEGV